MANTPIDNILGTEDDKATQEDAASLAATLNDQDVSSERAAVTANLQATKTKAAVTTETVAAVEKVSAASELSRKIANQSQGRMNSATAQAGKVLDQMSELAQVQVSSIMNSSAEQLAVLEAEKQKELADIEGAKDVNDNWAEIMNNSREATLSAQRAAEVANRTAAEANNFLIGRDANGNPLSGPAASLVGIASELYQNVASATSLHAARANQRVVEASQADLQMSAAKVQRKLNETNNELNARANVVRVNHLLKVATLEGTQAVAARAELSKHFKDSDVHVDNMVAEFKANIDLYTANTNAIMAWSQKEQVKAMVGKYADYNEYKAAVMERYDSYLAANPDKKAGITLPQVHLYIKRSWEGKGTHAEIVSDLGGNGTDIVAHITSDRTIDTQITEAPGMKAKMKVARDNPQNPASVAYVKQLHATHPKLQQQTIKHVVQSFVEVNRPSGYAKMDKGGQADTDAAILENLEVMKKEQPDVYRTLYNESLDTMTEQIDTNLESNVQDSINEHTAVSGNPIDWGTDGGLDPALVKILMDNPIIRGSAKATAGQSAVTDQLLSQLNEISLMITRNEVTLAQGEETIRAMTTAQAARVQSQFADKYSALGLTRRDIQGNSRPATGADMAQYVKVQVNDSQGQPMNELTVNLLDNSQTQGLFNLIRQNVTSPNAIVTKLAELGFYDDIGSDPNLPPISERVDTVVLPEATQ